MSLEDDLLRRLKDKEDLFVERKPTVDGHEIRETVVAFANSMRSPDTGVLFLGVNDDGTPNGRLGNPEDAQKKVRQHLRWCYPPIEGYEVCALLADGKDVVAVNVPESRNPPHFTGRVFVRKGPETVEASEELFVQMIDHRNDLCWELKPSVGKRVTVIEESYAPDHSGQKDWLGKREATLVSVNRFYVVINDGRGPQSISLRRIMLERDMIQSRPFLRVAMSALG